MKIAVAGVGMTALGKHEARSIKDLVREAVTAALTDAGVATGQIEAALFSNTRQPILEGQNAVRGQIALAPLGLDTIPIVNVENACASGSSAVAMGADMIRAGRAQTVLVVGAEKMVYRDRDELVMKAFRGGVSDLLRRCAEAFHVEPRQPGVDVHKETAPGRGRVAFGQERSAASRHACGGLINALHIGSAAKRLHDQLVAVAIDHL
ncbi:MAG: hypothetical protein JKP96_14965, partial [Oceanicaulis sp.]|nr:hypothetical protein [Oceanicaulis sp.]